MGHFLLAWLALTQLLAMKLLVKRLRAGIQLATKLLLAMKLLAKGLFISHTH